MLEQAGVEQAEMLIAVTDIDEVNMIACFTAKQYGVGICCARVRDPEYTDAFTRRSNRLLGIDRVINPDHLAAVEIVRLLKMPDGDLRRSPSPRARSPWSGLKVGRNLATWLGGPLRDADLGGTLSPPSSGTSSSTSLTGKPSSSRRLASTCGPFRQCSGPRYIVAGEARRR